MSLACEIRRKRQAFRIEPEPVCDRCGHGASLHTLHRSTPCIGCGERAAVVASPGPVCIGFASDWFDNSRRRRPAATVTLRRSAGLEPHARGQRC